MEFSSTEWNRSYIVLALTKHVNKEILKSFIINKCGKVETKIDENIMIATTKCMAHVSLLVVEKKKRVPSAFSLSHGTQKYRNFCKQKLTFQQNVKLCNR